MKIGACGIACGLCSLFAKGDCAGCAPGDDKATPLVLEAQNKKFGMVCLALDCASNKKVGYCLKDCGEFPCELLFRGYPYGKAWLNMFKKA